MAIINLEQSRRSGCAKLEPPQVHEKPHTFDRTIWYHMYSLWLFTFSDLKTIVIPKSFFAIITLLSGQSLTTSDKPHFKTILLSAPFIVAWIWLNLLPLDMSNQCDRDSSIEDKENKPWRPIPAGRLTIDETRWLTYLTYTAAILASIYMGGLAECLALIVEGWIYNQLGGANNSFLARNILNATGYLTFACGAARVACASSSTQLRGASLPWFVLLSAVISTTIQFQDLYDQKGDAVRGRRTIPLIAGDGVARLTVAIPVALWSWICPAFWGLDTQGFILPIALGATIISRLYWYRCEEEDKRSFLVWNLWVMSLYLLPLVKNAM